MLTPVQQIVVADATSDCGNNSVCLSSHLFVVLTKLDCECATDLLRIGWRVLKLSREFLIDAVSIL
jgi:hypothetical protein